MSTKVEKSDGNGRRIPAQDRESGAGDQPGLTIEFILPSQHRNGREESTDQEPHADVDAR